MRFLRLPRRRGTRVSLAVAAIVVLAAAGLFLPGAYQDWRDRQDVGGACSGHLDRGELTGFLASDSLRTAPLNTGLVPVVSGWQDICRVTARGEQAPTVRVDIGWTDAVSEIWRDTLRSDLSTPIGHGWSGFVDAQDTRAEATVILACADSERHLMVRALGEHDESDGPRIDAGDAASLARMAAGTAERAASEAGCTADPGGEIEDVALSPTYEDDGIGPQDAHGTCSSVSGHASSAARLGAATVLESEAGRSPWERCVLPIRETAAGADLRYELTAWYGPYAEDVAATTVELMSPPAAGANGNEPPLSEYDDDDVRAWGAARCPNEFGTARYTLEAFLPGSEPSYTQDQLAAQRELLNAFARDSAERHGCTNVRLP